MILPGLSLAAFVFVAALILTFRPDRMEEPQAYRFDVDKLGWAVSLCQTAAFGRPTLTLRPYRRTVTMRLEFQSEGRVLVVLPLTLKKQKAEQARLEALFREVGDEVVAYAHGGETLYLRAVLDRRDKCLSHQVEALYGHIFGVSSGALVNAEVETLVSDRQVLEAFYTQGARPKSDAAVKSLSHRYADRSVRSILVDRLVLAATLLLYPPIILFAYAVGDVTAVAWAVFGTSFLLLLRAVGRPPTAQTLATMALQAVSCGLAGAMLVSGAVSYLTILPPVLGAFVCIEAAIGHREAAISCEGDTSGTCAQHKRTAAYFLHALGVVIILAGIWSRQVMPIDDWVRFFAFLRIELAAAMMFVALPIYLIVLRAWRGGDSEA